jgi:hypothetical protein
MSDRVGILTLPLDPNYGGILQAVALRRFLSAHGKDVVFLTKRPPRPLRRRLKDRAVGAVPFGLIRATAGTAAGRLLRRQSPDEYAMARHRRFLSTYLPDRTARLHDARDLKDALRRHAIGAVVVGSDQVWNYGLAMKDGVETYFCEFVDDPNVRRIAYAASFGHDRWGFPQFTERARQGLAAFAAVSTREASGVRICAATLARDDCVHVLDPTLLADPDFYETMIAGVPATAGPEVLEYVLDADADKEALTREALAALDGPHGVRRLSATDGIGAVDVPGWLAAIRRAALVMTDSFHGTVFSILFRRNFVSVVNEARGADRFISLLDQLGLRDRAIARTEIDRVQPLVRAPIDFDEVHRRIARARDASARFLLAALA